MMISVYSICGVLISLHVLSGGLILSFPDYYGFEHNFALEPEPEPVLDSNRTKREDCACHDATFNKDVMEGTIKSPNYPDNYCNKAKCLYTIEPNPDMGVALMIEHMRLTYYTWDKDNVAIEQYKYINNQLEAIPHHKFEGGAHNSETDKYRRFESFLGGGFRIHFQSDDYYSMSGFLMKFIRHNHTTRMCPQPYLTATEKSENIPRSSNMDIYTGCPFQLNASIDHNIYLDGSQANGMRIAYSENGGVNGLTEIEGAWDHRLAFQSTNVRISNPRVPIKMPNNFTISFRQIESPCICANSTYVLGDIPITVTSPGFPIVYCPKFQCVTIFTTDPARDKKKTVAFLVKINEFSFAGEDNLAFRTNEIDDVLFVRTGTLSDMFSLEGTNLTMKFESIGKVTSTGYNITIRRIEHPNECHCPGPVLKVIPGKDKGYISMDIHPSCTFLMCTWLVSSMPYSSVYKVLELESRYWFASDTESISLYGGDKKNAITYSSTDSEDNHEYWSLPYYSSMSFAVTFKRNHEEENDVMPHGYFNISWKLSAGCACGMSAFRATVGEWKNISSPRWPDRYCNNVNCKYTITAPDGHKIRLNITYFSSEPINDVLAIFDAPNVDGKHMELLQGRQYFDYLIDSSNNTMSLWFKSDGSVTGNGFNILYSAEAIDDDSGSSSWFLYFIFLVIVAALVGVGYKYYKRNGMAFRNPMHMPSVHYSNETETISYSNPSGTYP